MCPHVLFGPHDQIMLSVLTLEAFLLPPAFSPALHSRWLLLGRVPLLLVDDSELFLLPSWP